MIITDIFWMIGCFILGSYAAREENNLTSFTNITINGNYDTVYNYVNKGVFTSTSVNMLQFNFIIFFFFFTNKCFQVRVDKSLYS